MRTTIFRSAFERFVAAREKQARRFVNGHLLALDDRALNALGHSREELRRQVNASYLF